MAGSHLGDGNGGPLRHRDADLARQAVRGRKLSTLLGNLTLQAISQRDFPMIQGTVLITAVVFTLINFLVDLTYAALDPRVRLQ